MTFQKVLEVIEYCLNFDSDIEIAYEFLQELYIKAKYSTFDDARDNLLDWCYMVERCNSKLPEIK